ncbi:MAG: type VI secretion system-associated protein TagF, partial [Gammaproteobacteria bacterium]|nr:type VI secretion system-associated protein TagF [Gammaproteobacteria bacterium]
CTHDQLGPDWLDVYLTSPVWRFALSAGVCGDAGWAGVLIPGVDRVGRYFPLTVAATLPPGAGTLGAVLEAESWFSALERVALSSLDDAFDLDRFDREVGALGPAPLAAAASAPAAAPAGSVAWHFALGASGAGAAPWPALAGGLLDLLLPHHSVWRTAGSDRVRPSLGVCHGLPPVRSCAALMDGQWARWGWQSRGPGLVTPGPAGGPAEALESLTTGDSAPGWVSAHATDPGRVRDHNEDALVDSRECGVWAVADGMGGHAEGHVASAAVARALDQVAGTRGLDGLVSAAREALARANRELRERARLHPSGDVIGSTVVTLLGAGDRLACLWAGDSRAYRYRDGRLSAITHDHNVLEELLANGQLDPAQAAGFEGGNALTRAVGGAEALQLDEVRLDYGPGDLYLLCSDGLTKELSEAEIATVLTEPDLQRACDALVAGALARGGRDNVTVVLVRAA